MSELTTIEIPPDLEWDDVLGNGTKLYATADIFGVQYHLDAIEVDEAGHAIDQDYEENLRYCQMLDNGTDDENPFNTAELRPGRQYVVYLLPGWKRHRKIDR
jgi:hypothetical protein